MTVTRYRRFAPPAELTGLVEHGWVTHDDGVGHREVLLPDGRGLALVVVGTPGVLVDPLAGTRASEATGLRGPQPATLVRSVDGAVGRLGLQLAPLAQARLAPGGRPGTVDRAWAAATGDVAAALVAGDDEAAARAGFAALAALPQPESDAADRLATVLERAERHRGLVRSNDLAREAGVGPAELHRWCVDLLGIEPRQWLSAVRFSAFVREVAGSGPLPAATVVQAIRWYVAAGYQPREVERFTGLVPAELRRLLDRLEAMLATPQPG